MVAPLLIRPSLTPQRRAGEQAVFLCDDGGVKVLECFARPPPGIAPRAPAHVPLPLRAALKLVSEGASIRAAA